MLMESCVARGATIAAMIAVCTLGACGSASKKAEPDPKPPVAAVLKTPKAFFIATPTNDARRLHALNADGLVSAIDFRDADGNPVPVQVDRAVALSSEWVWLSIWYPAKGGGVSGAQVIMRVADGKLFGVPSSWDPGSVQAKGNSLYSVNGAVERLDLTSMIIYPLNNPAYDTATGPFAVDHEGNVRAGELIGGAPSHKIFFGSGAPPVADPWGNGDTDLDLCPGGPDPLGNVYGEDGHLYAFCRRIVLDPQAASTVEYFVRQVHFTATGTQFTDAPPVRAAACGAPLQTTCPHESPMDVATPYTLNTRSRMIPFTSGFFTMTSVPQGGVALSWTDLALPAITVMSGEYGFWRAGDGIHRIHLQPGATPETVVVAPDLISWEVVDGVTLFTKYLTATAVATYRVTAPGVDPEVLSSSDMAIQQVVELVP
jgi:hypothetical protein